MKNKELLIFIFLLGIVGFNWPILAIVKSYTWLYLFLFWALLIGVVALFVYLNEKPK